MLTTNDFNYKFDKANIATHPASPRDSSKLLILNRRTGQLCDSHFWNLANLLTPNDVLVLNQTKVFPCRLLGQKNTGGKTEVLLLNQLTKDSWQAIGSNLKIGQSISFDHQKNFTAKVLNKDSAGQLELSFNLSDTNLEQAILDLGQTPIPPYIQSSDSESKIRKNYQTIYAKTGHSAAAPTAGLHFTKSLLSQILSKGVQIEYITLNVGLGTFQNLRPENIASKTLHTESYELDAATANRLNLAKKLGKRIIAVGTTTTRVLETCAKLDQNKHSDILTPNSSTTNIFIFPPYQFKFVDSLITNFHLPKSSLLMLVSAFSTNPNTNDLFSNFSNSLIGKAYTHAQNNGYRFFSFGDAMWII